METRGSELHPSVVAPKRSDRPMRSECSQRSRAKAFNRQAARNYACILTYTLEQGHAGPHMYLRRH